MWIKRPKHFFHSWNKLRAGLCFRTSETENLKALLIPGILPEKTFVRGKTQKSRNFFYKESNHQILPSFGLFSRLLMQLCSTTHKTNYCPTKFGSQREVENNSHWINLCDLISKMWLLLLSNAIIPWGGMELKEGLPFEIEVSLYLKELCVLALLSTSCNKILTNFLEAYS